MTKITSILNTLPSNARKELIDFAEFLKNKYSQKKKKNTLKLDWAGGLEKYKDNFEPVELQHNISDWWSSSNLSR